MIQQRLVELKTGGVLHVFTFKFDFSGGEGVHDTVSPLCFSMAGRSGVSYILFSLK